MEYQINIIDDIRNEFNDNVDVEVEFKNGLKYHATFFTLKNIEEIMNNYKNTRECLSGKYFWSSQMIIIEKLEPDLIISAIEDLIKSDEFEFVFKEQKE